MVLRVPILVCGDAGPSRHALLARRDLEVLWCDSVDGALATIRHADPKVCLVRPNLIEGSGEELLRRCRQRGAPPCVVVLEASDWQDEGRWLAAGAAEVIEMTRTEAMLQLIGEYTGLPFAKDARTRFETVVEVDVRGDERVLETSDVSASGVSIRGFPDSPVGTLARIAFVVQTRPIVLWARVVRCWYKDGFPMAGLRFVGIDEAQKDQLTRFVEAENGKRSEPPIEIGQLFDDLEVAPEASRALSGSDLIESLGSLSPRMTDPDVAVLETYMRTADLAERDALDLPPWLLRVEQSTTAIERTATANGSPLWAREALVFRVLLARCRAAQRDSAIPAHVAERAYDLFVRLPSEAHGASDEVIADVGAIRAALLRDLLKRSSKLPRGNLRPMPSGLVTPAAAQEVRSSAA